MKFFSIERGTKVSQLKEFLADCSDDELVQVSDVSYYSDSAQICVVAESTTEDLSEAR